MSAPAETLALQVDPDKFAVPYAVDAQANVYQIRNGRPRTKEIACPICRGKVSFVAEGDNRAAHFRHHDRSDCDKQAGLLRGTIHNDIRDAAVALLNGRYVARDICKGHEGIAMPTGFARAEVEVEIDGKTYRPDVTVSPKQGKKEATLELEVIWSHKPTPARLEAAASAGRVVGVLDATQIEKSYYQKRYANQAFDIPEAVKEYILAKRFSILTDRHLKRAVRGVLDRHYLKATVRREHRAAPIGATYQATSRPASPLPAQPRARRPETPREVEQEYPLGNTQEVADQVLERLSACSSESEMEVALARFSDVLRFLYRWDRERVTQINNVVDGKRADFKRTAKTGGF